jgi:mannose-1-phosphate guanylyltransferase
VLSERDAQGNAADPSSVLLDSSGNLVRDLRSSGGRRTVALIGVRDLCVVATDDAILVMPRERSQDVRGAVEALCARHDDDLV